MDLLLALDAGTTGVRAVAYDPQLVEVRAAYRALTQHFPAPGEVEHDPAEIARLAVEVLTEVAEAVAHDGHRVVAVGVTNQRETTVAFDRATGHDAHRAIVWQDRRTAPQCEALANAGALELVRTTTGLVLDPYFSGTKMRWLLDHGALEGAGLPSLCTIDTYLVWHLTGGVDGGRYVTEPSNASRTMLFDLRTLDWSPATCELLGVAPEYLASVQPSASHFGTIRADVVPALDGVPITGVLGDQQAALFGQACFQGGMVKATYGTGSFLLVNAGPTPPTPRDGIVTTVAWDLGTFGGPTYAYEGSAFVAGAAIQWLRDELGLLRSSEELGPLAASVTDSGGVVLVPAFTGLGSPFWRADARGVLMGLTRGSGRAQIARAVVEALAFQVRAMTDAFEVGGVVDSELRADGGAAAMTLLLELQATNSRTTVRRSTSLEATARGAASVAGLASGYFASLETLSALWTSDFEVTPQDPLFVDLGYDAWRRAVERA